MADHLSLDIQLQTAGRNKSFQSLFFVLTQLQYCQWSSLPFRLPSLIVQWLARTLHFELLRMINNVSPRKRIT